MLEPVQLIQTSIALLAFVLAFFTLVSRERKTPYATASVYGTLTVALICIALAVITSVLSEDISEPVRHTLLALCHLVLVVGFVQTIWRLLAIRNRDRNLRDDKIVRNSQIIRSIRRLWKPKAEENYDFRTGALTRGYVAALADAQLAPLEEIQRALAQNTPFSSVSFLIKAVDGKEARQLILRAVRNFLLKEGAVQFTSAIRHPADFILPLQASWDSQKDESAEMLWAEAAKRIFVVDAHTPHFGFGDSIHGDMAKRVAATGVTYIASRPTFAGIHTASADAYNQFKKSQAGGSRPPTLIIYEGLHALTDLESPEQYRIFCRHVVPSEKLWGRMVTVVVEYSVDGDGVSAVAETVDIVRSIPDRTDGTKQNAS